ncbi:hypothetical protein [Streptomyces sp. NPDC052721]|uniref:hypothetical protein n=1 Tax=Streptomyces sp. NPDC052721 TaxID=3154955 RepID=UPI003449E8F0
MTAGPGWNRQEEQARGPVITVWAGVPRATEIHLVDEQGQGLLSGTTAPTVNGDMS